MSVLSWHISPIVKCNAILIWKELLVSVCSCCSRPIAPQRRPRIRFVAGGCRFAAFLLQEKVGGVTSHRSRWFAALAQPGHEALKQDLLLMPANRNMYISICRHQQIEMYTFPKTAMENLWDHHEIPACRQQRRLACMSAKGGGHWSACIREFFRFQMLLWFPSHYEDAVNASEVRNPIWLERLDLFVLLAHENGNANNCVFAFEVRSWIAAGRAKRRHWLSSMVL